MSDYCDGCKHLHVSTGGDKCLSPYMNHVGYQSTEDVLERFLSRDGKVCANREMAGQDLPDAEEPLETEYPFVSFRLKETGKGWSVLRRGAKPGTFKFRGHIEWFGDDYRLAVAGPAFQGNELRDIADFVQELNRRYAP